MYIMARTAYVFEARREGYGIDQLDRPLTVGEFKAFLEGLDDDALVILSHDNGYTYGRLDTSCKLVREREGEYGIEWDTEDEIW